MKFISLITLFVSLTSCTKPPPDVPFCEHLSQRMATDPETKHLVLAPSPTCMKEIGEVECGHCTFSMSQKEIYIGEAKKTWFNKKPWSQLHYESILVPAVESFAPVQAYIINACEAANCSGDVQRFKVKVNSLKGIKDVLGIE